MGFQPNITRKAFLRYTLMPEIVSRLKVLIGSGFGNLAYLIASVYNATGLIPKGHSYLNGKNIGNYGIRHVVFEAWQNLKFDRRHIDQIIIFFAIALGIVLLFLQFVVLGFTIVTNFAMASGVFSNYFVTQFPDDDLAFRMLYLVFGTEMFSGGGASPFPIHIALYSLFEFYSYGIVLIGSFIIAYFTITVIGETAQTGVPFGKRFQHVWAPIRLIMFFALIIPITDGLNGAQWITLSVAKYGSSLASNGWTRFNATLASDPLGSSNSLVAQPNTPEFQNIVAFMMIAKTCQWAEGRQYGKVIDAYNVFGSGSGGSTSTMSTPYVTAVQNTAVSGSAAGNIIIRFGEKTSGSTGQHTGNVSPDCGELVLNTNDIGDPGALIIQTGYYDLIKLLWADGSILDGYAENYSRRYQSVQPNDPDAAMPGPEFKALLAVATQTVMRQFINNAVNAQRAAMGGMDGQMIRLGWGGAAIWYNRIAEQNGTMVSAAYNIPDIAQHPEVMEFVRTEKMRVNRNVTPKDRYNPRLADGTMVSFSNTGDREIAITLNQVYEYWNKGLRTDAAGVDQEKNPFIVAINRLLGTQGLFDMCANTNTHPLAQLSAVGKGLVDSAVKNLALAAGFGVLGYASPAFSGAAQSFSGMFSTIATVALMTGFTLFYVIPFMPFIYFFFAVGSWVKTVFEAMVGVPLWALAHLRIDGDGLAGQAANNGYLLLFEIFLRPIMIVFGLLAAIAIFAAQVKVLNEVFYLATSSIAGGSTNFIAGGGCATGPASGLSAAQLGTMTGAEQFMQGPINTFFFTVMYAILVYMMGMASFKLIDLIPNQIMRWFGSSASSFSDDNSPTEAADGLAKYATIGAGAIGSQLSEAVTSVPEAFESAGQEAGRRAGVEIEILATDRQLMPKHNSDIRGMQNQFDNIPGLVADPSQAAANQAAYDSSQAKRTYESLVAKQEAIMARVGTLDLNNASPTVQQAYQGQVGDYQSIQRHLEQHMQQTYGVDITQ